MLRTLKKASLLTVLALTAGSLAFGQMGTFMGKVTGEDGKGLQNAIIKIERKDIKGNWQTKSNKKGDWIYSGMPVPGQFRIVCEVNGQVLDQVDGIRSQMGDPVEVNFDLQKVIAKRKAMETAAATGQVTQEMARDMSPEQKAAMEKAMKERSAQMQKNKALNDTYNVGMAAMQAKDFPTAIDNFKKAAEIDPKQAAIWIQLAQAYDQLSNAKTGEEKTTALNDAATNYAKSLELLPADAGLHNNYGLVLAKQKKYDEARAELEKAAQLDPPGGGKYFFNLGAVFINTGQTDPAIGAFKKAVELDPKYAPAWFQLGSALSGKMTLVGDKPVPPEGMKEALEKYLELEPNGANAEAAKSLLSLTSGPIETKYENPDAKKNPKKGKK